jgi:xylan 1,4-beta-xylosidase
MKRPGNVSWGMFCIVVAIGGSHRCGAGETVLLPIAPQRSMVWRYVLAEPHEGWQQPDFDDASWKQGGAGFGTAQTPGTTVNTTWNARDIWLRTDFEFDGRAYEKAALHLYHDEDVTVYLNGIQVLQRQWFVPSYELYDVTQAFKKAVRKGRNVVAVTCHQTYGGQYIDVGIVLDPPQELQRQVALPPIKPLFDHPVRDTSICLAADGNYYLTGTTANNAGGPDDPQGWWYVNEGIRIWKSPDLKEWQPLGLVWKIEEGTWQKEFHGKQRALWAPEIHFLKGTFWLTFSMNFEGTGLLKSASGKPEGPYVDVHPQGPIAGNIDASLFKDDDGTVYFVWQNGLIARMQDDMTDLAEKPRLLKPSNHQQVGFEGAYLTKHGGRYYLICADFMQGDYDCMVAESDRVYGPYGPRYLAIPHGGHNMFFTDKDGNWWATFFGSDPRAPLRERPAILRIELDETDRVTPLREEPCQH